MVTTQEGRTSRLRQYVSLACGGLALILTFIRLIHFDAPLTRFVRSLNDFYIDHLHDPWLALLSDLGNEVGRGEFLVLVSGVLIAAGYTLRHTSMTRAGWETLLAHVIAGGINTGLKHFVGRGRPKFMHVDTSIFVPFGGKGWDSFPSGHAMASFAIATVLGVRFPKLRWPMIVLAMLISVSRLFRGSHFLTDIVAGAVTGILIGAVVAHPWKDWRSSLTTTLFTVMPPLAALLAIMTTIGQPPLQGRFTTLLSQGGLLMVLMAMIAYVLIKVRPGKLPVPLMKMAVVGAMGLGVAMCSGSLWVATVFLLMYMAFWLRTDFSVHVEEPISRSTWPYEAAFGLAVLLTLYTMMELRGVLPMG